MNALLYMVVIDGVPCVVGLVWREACVEATRLMRLLDALCAEDDWIVTISTVALGEPCVSWHRVRGGWDCVSAPVWRLRDAA